MKYDKIIIKHDKRDRVFDIIKCENDLLTCEWMQSNGNKITEIVPVSKTKERTYLKAKLY